MARAPGALTQKAKFEIARAIIDRYELNEPFTEPDLKALGDITNTVLAGAWKRRNPEYRGDKRHLHVIAYDWPEPRQWSWRKAIQFSLNPGPEADERRALQKRLLALRQAIRDDLREFKASADPYACANCDTRADLTVDHVKPSFHMIAMEFLKIHPDFSLKEVQGMSDAIADDSLEAEWLAYHASHAVYQLLCRSCNSSKGARCK